jgi:hypothetical protein
MRYIMTLLAVPALLGLLCLAGSPARADDKDKPKEIKPTKDWKGSIDDEALEKKAPADRFITDAKTFKQLWEDWKLGEKVPEIDFKKEVVLVETTRGGRLNVNTVRLTDKGDLQALAIATRDLRPGFRYAVLVVPREGVKTINGKELKEEK